jgi:hypothetical protein
VIDIAGILVEPEVTEHRRYTAVCPYCHGKAHAKLPGGNSKKTSYGPKLQALVIYLSVAQSVTFDRIAETMRDVFCVKSFSEGTVKNILERNARKAQPVYTALLEYIGKEEAAGMDETGVYINKLLCWFLRPFGSKRTSSSAGACSARSTATSSPTAPVASRHWRSMAYCRT